MGLLEPTNLLLLACALIYGLVGEPLDGAILLVFGAAISLLDALQHQRSNRALAELARLSAPKAHGRRAGVALELAADQLERGDLLRLEEGDRVAADARVVEALGLWLDESLLTAQSLPLGKSRPGSSVLAGSLVASGRGWAEVVAVAQGLGCSRLHGGEPLPASGEAPSNVHDFLFAPLGLIALADPLRADAAAAIATARSAGVRVVMITGDGPITARSIADQAGLPPGRVLCVADLAELGPAGLAEQLASVSVFARVMPQQKLLLVQALQVAGEVVAMTGDGVNDAPALKAADSGVAMGRRGTAVARLSPGNRPISCCSMTPSATWWGPLPWAGASMPTCTGPWGTPWRSTCRLRP